jgi:hypothetical protein
LALIFKRLTELIFVDVLLIFHCLSCRDNVDNLGVRIAAVDKHDQKKEQTTRHANHWVTLLALILLK